MYIKYSTNVYVHIDRHVNNNSSSKRGILKELALFRYKQPELQSKFMIEQGTVQFKTLLTRGYPKYFSGAFMFQRCIYLTPEKSPDILLLCNEHLCSL